MAVPGTLHGAPGREGLEADPPGRSHTRPTSLFGCFIGTTAQSDSSLACMSGLWLLAFPDRSARADTKEVSRFSCLLFLDVLGSSTTPGLTSAREISAARQRGLPADRKGSAPGTAFSELNRPAHRCLCLRFTCYLAAADARLEVRMESLLLSCRALSSPTTCRLIPAHSVPARPRRPR